MAGSRSVPAGFNIWMVGDNFINKDLKNVKNQ